MVLRMRASNVRINEDSSPERVTNKKPRTALRMRASPHWEFMSSSSSSSSEGDHSESLPSVSPFCSEEEEEVEQPSPSKRRSYTKKEEVIKEQSNDEVKVEVKTEVKEEVVKMEVKTEVKEEDKLAAIKQENGITITIRVKHEEEELPKCSYVNVGGCKCNGPAIEGFSFCEFHHYLLEESRGKNTINAGSSKGNAEGKR